MITGGECNFYTVKLKTVILKFSLSPMSFKIAILCAVTRLYATNPSFRDTNLSSQVETVYSEQFELRKSPGFLDLMPILSDDVSPMPQWQLPVFSDAQADTRGFNTTNMGFSETSNSRSTLTDTTQSYMPPLVPAFFVAAESVRHFEARNESASSDSDIRLSMSPAVRPQVVSGFELPDLAIAIEEESMENMNDSFSDSFS